MNLRSCVECGARVHCYDRDEFALCVACLQVRADAQAQQLVADEPSTDSPEDLLVACIDRERSTERAAQELLATLTPREREVLHADPSTTPKVTREQIRDAERGALARLRARAQKPEDKP